MTHAERVLQLLADGKPHSHLEGYRLGVMLHSRVADLRKKGHRIECWRDGDQYLYQLQGPSPISPPSLTTPTAAVVGGVSEDGPAGGEATAQPAAEGARAAWDDSHTSSLTEVHPDQLTLEAA